MSANRPSTFNVRLVLASGVLLLTLSLAWWLNARQPQPVTLIPTLTGQPEYCLTCHADLPEISASHPVKTFGCVLCHGGEPLALDADLAHSTMRGGANPSDLSVVEQSCGGSNCHSGSAADSRDHIQRVMTSIQSTYAGAIANIRYSFGAQPGGVVPPVRNPAGTTPARQPDLTARFGIQTVSDNQITTKTGLPSLQAFDPAKDSNPAIQEFAANCLTCHINAKPREGQQSSRFAGCSACHSPLSPRERGEPEGGNVHTLTTSISYTQCNTCHNRGNYDLRAMTFVERTDQPADRLHDYYQPIAQFTKCEYTLDCVDCHTRVEAMGDGDIHSSKKDIQYIQCRTCHGTLMELPLTKTLTDPNDIAFRLAQLNQIVDLKPGDTILQTEKGEPLWNTRVLSDGTYQLIGKSTELAFTFKPVMGTACEQKPDEQASQYCHQCHAVQR